MGKLCVLVKHITKRAPVGVGPKWVSTTVWEKAPVKHFSNGASWSFYLLSITNSRNRIWVLDGALLDEFWIPDSGQRWFAAWRQLFWLLHWPSPANIDINFLLLNIVMRGQQSGWEFLMRQKENASSHINSCFDYLPGCSCRWRAVKCTRLKKLIIYVALTYYVKWGNSCLQNPAQKRAHLIFVISITPIHFEAKKCYTKNCGKFWQHLHHIYALLAYNSQASKWRWRTNMMYM